MIQLEAKGREDDATVVLLPINYAREDDGDVVMPIFESRQCGIWGKGNALTRVVMP